MTTVAAPQELQQSEWETRILLLQTTCPFVLVTAGELVEYNCRYRAWATHLPACKALDDWQGECVALGCAKECRLVPHLTEAALKREMNVKAHLFAVAACQFKRDLFAPKVNGIAGSWGLA